NLGFNIYREQNGVRTLVNPSLIAGSALMVGRETRMTAGFAYTWTDKGVGSQESGASDKGTTYWLEDVDLDGTSTMHGPIVAAKSQAQSAKGAERSPMLEEIGSVDTGTSISSWPAAEGQRSEVRSQKAE